MSKARRPKYQRHGGKHAPIVKPAVPTAGAIADAPAPPQPVAAAPLHESAPIAADIAETGSSSAGDMTGPLSEPLSVGSPEVSPQDISRHAALSQDEAEPPPASPSPSPDTLPALAPVMAHLSLESFGTTVMNYFLSEGEAMGAHWRALSGARSMAEVVRLQIGEFQRAADATLTCWGTLTLAAGRTVAPR
jgi:hypothetical protein